MNSKQLQRLKRKKRVAQRISTAKNPFKVIVYRSLKHTYAQLIDMKKKATLASSSDLKISSGTKQEKAKTVGLDLAQKAINAHIEKIVFDRSSYKYHGRVKNVAEGLREGGLKF